VPDRFDPASLAEPIVQAPMAGGPSTPELAVAVCEAGGLGFLATAYRTIDDVRADLSVLRAGTSAPFGTNLFVPAQSVDEDALPAYLDRLRREAERYGVGLGEARWDDDGWDAKLALVADERPAVVSFTFGCPAREVVADLQGRGVAVWVTVTTPDEAAAAAAAGADALVVQGVEGGGHRGGFDDAAPGDLGVLALLQLVAARVDLPLVATGGIMTGRGVAAVLVAGAVAAQLGTAFLLTPEAATSAPHRSALAGSAPTMLTRAFSGRTARGIANRFALEHSAAAPRGWPHVNGATQPVRAAARKAGDADGINLWAGQAYALARPEPAADVVRRLGAEARAALGR
jgi:nitronate monooxygenase